MIKLKNMLTEKTNNKQIYMTIAISGMGKSTYVNSHFDKNVIVCPDEIRKEVNGDISSQANAGLIWSKAEDNLLKKLEVYDIAVLDATNLNQRNRQRILDKCGNAEKIALVFKPNVELAKSRISTDIKNGKERSNVPADVIDRQYQQFKDGYGSINSQFDKVVYI